MAPGTGVLWFCTLLIHLPSLLVQAASSSCPSACLCSNIGSNSSRIEVDCQFKNLVSVPTNLRKHTELLNMNGNKLTSLSAETFSGLADLINIRLRFNNIATVHKNSFKNLKKIQELRLDHNRIASLSPKTFKYNNELVLVSLSNNPLTRLEDGLFSNKEELLIVEVDYCGLTYVGAKAFENVPKLYYLYLSGNKLTSVDLSILLPLRNLRMILHKNPWKCDCKLRPLRDLVVKQGTASGVKWSEVLSPSCAEPSKLANKTWVEVKSEDFVC